MWVMTSFGAFSATQRDEKELKRGDERYLQVRARRAKHLKELKRRYIPNASDIVRLAHRDYEFRIYCTHDEWALALARLAQEIDYGNFKNTVKDKDLHDAYIRVWSALYNALATNKYVASYKGRKGRKGGKSLARGTSTVSTSYKGDIWAGWEDVDDEPAYDRRSVLDEFPELQWR